MIGLQRERESHLSNTERRFTRSKITSTRAIAIQIRWHSGGFVKKPLRCNVAIVRLITNNYTTPQRLPYVTPPVIQPDVVDVPTVLPQAAVCDS